VGRGVYLQQISLIAALIEAYAPLGIADQFKLRLLQLEIVHIEPLIHATGIEEELVGGDGEERPGQVPDAVHIEVLQVLAGEDGMYEETMII